MVNPLLILFCIILALLLGRMTNVDIVFYETKLLGQVDEIIERGNFSYFYIYSAGPLLLNLTSVVGDADMYISDTNMYPTYHPDSYKLHSATCGHDIIEIPENFEYPLAVGIYGYAEYSVFSLEIFDVPSYNNTFWLLITKDPPASVEETKKIEETNKKSNNKPIPKKKKSKTTSSTLTSIFSLLEVIQLIFL